MPSFGRDLVRNPDFAIVGEAWGEQEERSLTPFFGPAGQELTRQLKEVGIDRFSSLLTNVFNFRPTNNDLRTLTLSRSAAIYTYDRVRPELAARHPNFPWPAGYDFPPLVGPSAFLHPEYLGELARLYQELVDLQPKMVIALGNTACWALLRTQGIGKLRGYLHVSTLVPGLRVIPTYHPSSVLRQYANRPVVIADLAKAKRLATAEPSVGGAGTGLGARSVWIGPTLEDLEAWWNQYGAGGAPLAIDIETFGGTITCIGFGTKNCAISVPFWDKSRLGGNYWESVRAEVSAMKTVISWLQSSNPKILQNAQYDLQYLWRTWGVWVKNVVADTMLLHHALQPELEKGLGFLGSAYTDVPAWKNMRKISEQARKKGKKDE